MSSTRRQFLMGLSGLLASTPLAKQLPALKPHSSTPSSKPLVLAIQGFMDTKTEVRVRAAWERLAKAGITDNLLRGGTRPHMTLASWLTTRDPLELVDDLHRTARTLSPLSTVLSLTSDSPNHKGIYLLPSAEDHALVDFHARLHADFGAPGKPQRPIDLPGQWWPHLSVAYGFDSSRLQEAVELCSDLQTVNAGIEYIGLVTFGPIRYPAVFALAH